VYLPLNDDAAGVKADLALMKERAKRRRANSVVHVHVVEDDHRIETAELHHGSLQSAPGTFRKHSRSLDSADQIDDPDLGTVEELVGYGARSSRRMSDNVNYSGGEPGFLRNFREHDPCRDRSELRWFDHDGVPGRHQ